MINAGGAGYDLEKKLARYRRSAGHDVIDQSAGDIDDVGQPLARLKEETPEAE